MHAIGVSLYTARENGTRTRNQFATSGCYSYTRSTVIEAEIEPGAHGDHYLIPTTFDPGEENAFAVKVFWQGGPDDVTLTLQGA